MAEKKMERFELLLEEIRDNVKTVAEGHEVIRLEMRRMEGRLTEKIEGNKSAVKFAAKQLGGKIDKVDEKLEEHVRVPHAVGG